MDEEMIKSIAGQLRRPHGDQAKQIGEMMNQGNLHINLNTIKALQLKASEHILEIGMGNGFFVRNILSAEESIRYTGCDFSEAMVNEANKINTDFVNNNRAVFYHTNAEKLPPADETVDKVFTINTIYFWENQSAIFTEIRRVLKPKGMLIISIRPKSLMQHYPFTKYGFNMFTKEELNALLTENGFIVKEIIELNEPEQEIAGQSVPLETLIISAEKKAFF